MRTLRGGAIPVALVAVGTYAALHLDKSARPTGGADVILLLVGSVCVLFWLATTARGRAALFPAQGPRMVISEPEVLTGFVQLGINPPEEIDHVVVRVHNAAAGAGEQATARGALPEVTIRPTDESRVCARHKGWDVGGNLDFTPAGEEHTLYIAGKKRSDSRIYATRGRPYDEHAAPGVELFPGQGFGVDIALNGFNFDTVTKELLLTNHGSGSRPMVRDMAPIHRIFRKYSGWRGWLRERWASLKRFWYRHRPWGNQP